MEKLKSLYKSARKRINTVLFLIVLTIIGKINGVDLSHLAPQFAEVTEQEIMKFEAAGAVCNPTDPCHPNFAAPLVDAGN